MIEAILIVGIILVFIGVACLVFLVLHYNQSKFMNTLLVKDSTRVYLDAIQNQKTDKPFSPRRNGVQIEDNRKIEVDESGTNLLEMDPDEAYDAIMGTMGVTESDAIKGAK